MPKKAKLNGAVPHRPAPSAKVPTPARDPRQPSQIAAVPLRLDARDAQLLLQTAEAAPLQNMQHAQAVGQMLTRMQAFFNAFLSQQGASPTAHGTISPDMPSGDAPQSPVAHSDEGPTGQPVDSLAE